MRATDLLGMDVIDDAGRSLGRVLDARLAREDLSITGLFVGRTRRARFAAAIGAAQGRLQAPSVLRRIADGAPLDLVEAHDVAEWGPTVIRIRRQGGPA